MIEGFPLALILVREVAGVPMDYLLMTILLGIFFGLIIWGSRPSVLAKYQNRPDVTDDDVTDDDVRGDDEPVTPPASEPES